MMVRALGLLVLVALGAAWGLWQQSPWVAAAGAVLGAALWVLFDSLQARRALAWFTDPRLDAWPRVSGVWAELIERTVRQLRRLTQEVASGNARLDDFLAAIQASPNGVVLLDERGRIEWCNLTAADHLGFDPQRDRGNYVRNMVRSPVFTAYLNAGDFGHEIQIEAPSARPSQPRQISVQIHPYGRQRQLMLSRDITAVQLAEAMRRDFVANVSHEIRTPLTVLGGFVETLQTLALSEAERAQYLGLMAQQAQRMQTLVSDLLTLSRLEGSPALGAGEWCDAQALLAQIGEEARGLSRSLGGTPHDIVVEDGPALNLSGVRSELHSAMSNLVSNAVRYTPAGGRIRLGWQIRPDGAAVFRVSDSGVGIAPEHLPRLTERFYRVDHSRSRETGGTGLGLAIVKHVVQRHGGQLQVESTLGQGSVFGIVWPASRVQVR